MPTNAAAPMSLNIFLSPFDGNRSAFPHALFLSAPSLPREAAYQKSLRQVVTRPCASAWGAIGRPEFGRCGYALAQRSQSRANARRHVLFDPGLLFGCERALVTVAGLQ